VQIAEGVFNKVFIPNSLDEIQDFEREAELAKNESKVCAMCIYSVRFIVVQEAWTVVVGQKTDLSGPYQADELLAKTTDKQDATPEQEIKAGQEHIESQGSDQDSEDSRPGSDDDEDDDDDDDDGEIKDDVEFPMPASAMIKGSKEEAEESHKSKIPDLSGLDKKVVV
jgi:hypothetical protein